MTIVADLNHALTRDRAGILRWLEKRIAAKKNAAHRTHDSAPLLTLSTNWHGLWMRATKIKPPTHTKGNHDRQRS